MQSRRTRANGPTELTTEAVDSDRKHVGVLKSRGYEPTGQYWDWRICTLETEISAVDPPTGYTIGHLVSPEGLEKRASLTEHPYAVHLVRAPTYRSELNLAVIAPDGHFAAFCMAWLDEQNRVGVFEPVECLAEFHRRGLTRAMMSEGMLRLSRLGAAEACIVNRGDNIPARRLYESLEFHLVGRIELWRRIPTECILCEAGENQEGRNSENRLFPDFLDSLFSCYFRRLKCYQNSSNKE